MFTLLVQVEVRAEMLDEFIQAVGINAAESVLRDQGCLRFEVSQVIDQPTRWVFYEVYTDEGAWERHRLSPHFVAYKAVADRALRSREATRLRPMAPRPAS